MHCNENYCKAKNNYSVNVKVVGVWVDVIRVNLLIFNINIKYVNILTFLVFVNFSLPAKRHALIYS